MLRVVVCRRLKWTVGLSGSQTQACGPSIKQNRHQSSAIDVHKIMFNQLGSRCSSMLLWRGNAAPPQHHPPPIQSYRRYANRHCARVVGGHDGGIPAAEHGDAAL